MDHIRAFGCDIGSAYLTLLLPASSSKGMIAIKAPIRDEAPEALAPATIAQAQIGLSEVGTFAIAGLFGNARFKALETTQSALIVTEGFLDLPRLIPRGNSVATPDYAAMIPLAQRVAIHERIDADGEIVSPLDEPGMRAVSARLADAGVNSLGIFFLHAARNPTHEKRAADIARTLIPDAWIICSHEMCPAGPTLERLRHTMAATLVLPNLRRRERCITTPLRRWGLRGAVSHISALGGLLMNDASGAQLMECVDGGRTAGIVGAGFIAAASGLRDAIVCDIGGAWTRVATVRHGEAPPDRDSLHGAGADIANHRMALIELPLGGHSVARLDDDGLLAVGPRPSRAGPICLGDGGTEVTVTDALAALGLVNPRSLTPTPDKADALRAREVIEEALARPLDLPMETVAAAILNLFRETLAPTILDCLRAFGAKSEEVAVIFCGGAAPQHAAGIGRHLGSRTLILPRAAGMLGAFGAVVGDWQQNIAIAADLPVQGLDPEAFATLLNEAKRAIETVPTAPTAARDAAVTRFETVFRIDASGLRLAVPCPAPGERMPEPRRLLAQATQARFGQPLDPSETTLEAIRAIRISRRPGLSLDCIAGPPQRAAQIEQARSGKRITWFGAANEGAGGWLEVLEYEAARLPANARLLGPVIITAPDTTYVIEPHSSVVLDGSGNLRLQVEQTGGAQTGGAQTGIGTEIARIMGQAGDTASA